MAPSKSKVTYGMLGMINTARLAVYKEQGGAEGREFWKEVRACRYWLRAADQLAWGVPETEGHDDFVTSLALVCRAAEELAPPAAGGLLRARSDHEEGW